MGTRPDLYMSVDANAAIPVQSPNLGCQGAVPIVAAYALDVKQGDILDVTGETVFNNHGLDRSVVVGTALFVIPQGSPYPCDGEWTGMDCTPANPYIPFTKNWVFVAPQDYPHYTYVALYGYAGSDVAPGSINIWTGQTRIVCRVWRKVDRGFTEFTFMDANHQLTTKQI